MVVGLAGGMHGNGGMFVAGFGRGGCASVEKVIVAVGVGVVPREVGELGAGRGRNGFVLRDGCHLRDGFRLGNRRRRNGMPGIGGGNFRGGGCLGDAGWLRGAGDGVCSAETGAFGEVVAAFAAGVANVLRNGDRRPEQRCKSDERDGEEDPHRCLQSIAKGRCEGALADTDADANGITYQS